MSRNPRLGAYAASAALALTTALPGAVIMAAPAAAASHDPIGVDQGADWLEGQLSNGLMYNPNYGGFNDYGLSVDTGLALETAGRHPEVTEILTALSQDVDAYVKPYGAHVYSGGLAKLGTLAALRDQARDLGGRDLVAEVEASVASAAPIEGRLEDTGYTPGDQFDDDSVNTLGQAYAANLLSQAGSAKADSVTSFLLAQQCSSGYFRVGLTPDKTATNQSCVEGTDNPDTDATAIAVLQLASQAGDPVVDAAVARAKTWLIGEQDADGSFGGGTATEASNANSTGLAAWALGDTYESGEAAIWLREHQANDTDTCTGLAGDRGAVAYDDAGLDAGRSDGIDDASSDQWRRASAQALPGLAYLPVDATPAAPSLSGPSGFRKAGGQARLATAGVDNGDVLCLSGPGVKRLHTATGSTWTTAFALPAGTATRTYTVSDADGHSDTVGLKVLGRKQLAVRKSRSSVRRSARLTVVVRGLAPGERARIYYKGTLKKRGLANSVGRLQTSFRVGRATGRKRIVAYGQFADIRRGTAVVRVRR